VLIGRFGHCCPVFATWYLTVTLPGYITDCQTDIGVCCLLEWV